MSTTQYRLSTPYHQRPNKTVDRYLFVELLSKINRYRHIGDYSYIGLGGPSLEDFTAQTPLTVGSPQQVIERTLGFRDYVGDYQRQLFLIDHAGLPLKTVLEQLDILGEEVVPVLRREFAALKPAHVPEAPTHASLVAAAGGAHDGTVYAAADDVTGQTVEARA